MDTGSIQTTSLKLDKVVLSRIRQLATLKRRSAHWVMKEAIPAVAAGPYVGQSFQSIP